MNKNLIFWGLIIFFNIFIILMQVIMENELYGAHEEILGALFYFNSVFISLYIGYKLGKKKYNKKEN